MYNSMFNPISAFRGSFVVLDEDTFVEELRNNNWSEDTIAKEVANLREYKSRFKIEQRETISLTDEELDNPIFVASARRKLKGIVEDINEDDDTDVVDLNA